MIICASKRPRSVILKKFPLVNFEGKTTSFVSKCFVGTYLSLVKCGLCRFRREGFSNKYFNRLIFPLQSAKSAYRPYFERNNDPFFEHMRIGVS